MKSETICVVDDDLVYQFTAKKMLSKLDTVNGVLTFSDGEEAYNYFKNHIAAKDKLPGLIFFGYKYAIYGWLDLFKHI